MEGQDLLQKLVDFVSTASPKVWEVFLKQVAVQQATRYYEVLASLICIVILLILARVAHVKRHPGAEDFWVVLCCLLVAVSVCIICVLLISTIPQIIQNTVNPEFSAVQIMLSLVKGK
jgi:hypothetical protein